MRSLYWIVALAHMACGPSAPSMEEDLGSGAPDAGPQVEGPRYVDCNPVTQQGCEDEEKCVPVVEAEGSPEGTACVPNGDVPPGGACTHAALDPSGYDACASTSRRGYFCYFGHCAEICSQGPPDTCQEGSCLPINSFSTENGVPLGSCAPSCDPVVQDCEIENRACYLQTVSAETRCSPVTSQTVDRLQGSPCYGPDADSCYINACGRGYGAVLNKAPGDQAQVCAFFCNPSTTVLVGDPEGIQTTFESDERPNGPGPAYECRWIRTFYTNTPDVPRHIGMAVDPEVWGSCADDVPGEYFVPGCRPTAPSSAELEATGGLPTLRDKRGLPGALPGPTGEPLY